MASGEKRIATTNIALLIIGVILLIIGFFTVGYQHGFTTTTFNGRTASVRNYPYFTGGTIIVLAGMAFLASGLIYSPLKPKPALQVTTTPS